MLEASPRLAEFVGILLGDGSISIYPSTKYSTYYRTKVTFHSQDLDYMDYVSNLMQFLLNEIPKRKFKKNENTAELLIFKKHIVELLVDLGMKTSPKWDCAKIPEAFMTRELGKYVLRGYFDTDGSVVLANNNGKLYPRLEMKVSPSPMQEQILGLLDLYGFQYGSYQIGKGKIRIQMNGLKSLKRWDEIVKFSNIKHKNKSKLLFCSP